MRFRRLTDGNLVSLKKYVPNVLQESPNSLIYIGCDSQVTRNKVIYATAVVFRYTNGAHILYNREKYPLVKDLWSRLWKEVEKSIEVAEFLRKECGIKATRIDLDYNEDPKYPSNKLVKAAVGYVESLGYNAKTKPGLLLATYAADGCCR